MSGIPTPEHSSDSQPRLCLWKYRFSQAPAQVRRVRIPGAGDPAHALFKAPHVMRIHRQGWELSMQQRCWLSTGVLFPLHSRESQLGTGCPVVPLAFRQGLVTEFWPVDHWQKWYPLHPGPALQNLLGRLFPLFPSPPSRMSVPRAALHIQKNFMPHVLKVQNLK